jgi:hypothetical protein
MASNNPDLTIFSRIQIWRLIEAYAFVKGRSLRHRVRIRPDLMLEKGSSGIKRGF